MIDLYTYINEGVLDDIEDTLKNSDNNIIAIIKEFINSNYKCTGLKISKRPNSDGKYVVDAKNSKVYVTNVNIVSLTNGLFVWGVVKSFYCYNCSSLTSLEGAPTECYEFSYYNCSSLTSLEGAPTKCNSFGCGQCNSLTSLKGAPKECNLFDCGNCSSLKSLNDAPAKCNFFYCNGCNSLASLDGAPKKL